MCLDLTQTQHWWLKLTDEDSNAKKAVLSQYGSSGRCLYPISLALTNWDYFVPSGPDTSPSHVTPHPALTSTHLYSWVKRSNYDKVPCSMTCHMCHDWPGQDSNPHSINYWTQIKTDIYKALDVIQYKSPIWRLLHSLQSFEHWSWF